MKITPVYKITASHCELMYDEQQYMVDFQDMNNLVNLKVDWFKGEYPYFVNGDSKCSLLEFIFAPDADISFQEWKKRLAENER